MTDADGDGYGSSSPVEGVTPGGDCDDADPKVRCAEFHVGNDAEFTLKTYPGRVFRAKVDSIVWAQGQGQVMQSGALPQTGAYPQVPGRFPVKFEVAEKDREQFLAAGADGTGAIYTEHVQLIHMIRMVIVRVGTITDYLVLKLH